MGVRWLGWEDPCFEWIHLLEKEWIFRGQDGQDTNKVREVMSSKLPSGLESLESLKSFFFACGILTYIMILEIYGTQKDIYINIYNVFLGHRPICNQRVSIQQESCFSFWNLGWFQMQMPDWQYKRSNVQWPGMTHRRILWMAMKGVPSRNLTYQQKYPLVVSCITDFLLEMLRNSVGGFLFLHPLVRFLDRPGVHELGKQHAVMAAWVASGDFETPAEVTVTPKTHQNKWNADFCWLDWLAVFWMCFFHILGGFKLAFGRIKILQLLFFFGMLEVSLVAFWRWHLSGPCKTPRETQKAEGRPFWLTKGIFLVKVSQPHLFTSSPRKFFYYLDFLKFPQRHVFRQICFFQRPSVWDKSSITMEIWIYVSGSGCRSWGLWKCPVFRKDR